MPNTSEIADEIEQTAKGYLATGNGVLLTIAHGRMYTTIKQFWRLGLKACKGSRRRVFPVDDQGWVHPIGLNGSGQIQSMAMELNW
jgi:hypothetical protein